MSDFDPPEYTKDWPEAIPFKDQLFADGWRSPDTYCRQFDSLIDGPAVYLFLLHEDCYYERATVAYVGMSKRLTQRMSGHPVFSELWNIKGMWPMRWFIPTEEKLLRERESELIAKYDPPWNIQGRTGGLKI